jgi:hypothetical protein
MRRYIVLLLITGILWGQADLDKLVLKDGTTYFGEYSKIEEEIVYFKPQNAFTFQPISIKQIQTLKLKDGHFIIVRGHAKKIIPLAIEEYQKLSTKEKAIYDAKSKGLGKWYLFGSMSTILFGGSIFLHEDLIGGEFWESPIFLVGSPAASLIIPYLLLNINEKFNFPKSILTDSEKEIYEQAYSKKLKQRKIKYAVGSTILAGAVFVGVGLYSFGQAMKGFDMGPQPPGPW